MMDTIWYVLDGHTVTTLSYCYTCCYPGLQCMLVENRINIVIVGVLDK